jgi:hypothetical protein
MLSDHGGEHPDANIHGFVLRSMYVHTFANNQKNLVRRNLKFTKFPHLQSLSSLNERRTLLNLPVYDSHVHSKTLVVALSRLNLLAYPGPLDPGAKIPFPKKEVLAQVYAAGDAIWGANNDMDKELANLQALDDTIAAEISSTPGAQWNYKFTPNSANDTIGVAALEFARGNLSVLVFRGSYSPGDFSNINNWVYDWIFDAMSARMKDAWVREAGLPWDAELSDREAQSTFKQTLALQAFRWTTSPYMSKSFAGDLLSAATRIANFSYANGEEGTLGYWPIVRRIADDARAAARARGHTLHLSGHSQVWMLPNPKSTQASLLLLRPFASRVHGVLFCGAGKLKSRLAGGFQRAARVHVPAQEVRGGGQRHHFRRHGLRLLRAPPRLRREPARSTPIPS